MRRTTPLTVTGLLGLALLAPTSVATAAGETCRGEKATIVGTGGRDIVGTEGRDVVVTNRSGEVDTRGGDDLVCVTGPDKPRGAQALITVDTGAGDDLVDGTAARDWAVTASLGAGSDAFYGGGADDSVTAGERDDSYAHLDSERDLLSGGGGNDSFTSGQDGLPNADSVRLGQGEDSLSWSGTATGAVAVSGGPGTDRLSVSTSAAAITIDDAAGRLTEDGRPVLGWSALEGFSVRAADREDLAVTFVGTDDPEDLTLGSAGATVTASFGGGRDSLTTSSLLLDGSVVDGGGGRDLLYVVDRDRILSLDLAGEVLHMVDTVSRRTTVRGVEDAELHGRTVGIDGTDGRNELRVSACSAVVRGLGGDDVILRSSEEWYESSPPCRSERYTLNGGDGADELSGWRGDDQLVGAAGDDVLAGLPGDDTLIGGSGRDRADGSTGRDRCVAERRTSCER